MSPLINIALVAPSRSEYSETFIQAHRSHLNGNIVFYFGGYTPTQSERKASLTPANRIIRLLQKIRLRLSGSLLSMEEFYLLRSFKNEKIQIVYAEFGPTGVGCLNVCKELSIPLIVNFHGYDASIASLLNQYKNDYICLFQYAYSLVAVSLQMKKRLIEIGALPEKVKWSPCAPNDLFFSIDPRFSERALVSVGRFTDKKAPYYTILAFYYSLKTYDDLKLYMVGEGELLFACRNLCNGLGIANHVVFLGKQRPEQIGELFQRAWGYIQHSVTADNGDQEGTPVAILEAGASGLPVIATAHAGISDIVIDGNTGFLSCEHDVDAMAKNIRLLFSDKNVAMKIGHNARERIANNFSMTHHIGTLNEIIQSAVNQY